MKCPDCGTEGFYQGMFEADCPNEKCRHYQNRSKPDPAPAPPAAPANAGPLTIPVPAPAQPAPAQPNAGGVAVSTLTITIVSATPKINSVELKFQCDGDPGFPDKKAQFEFWVPGVISKTLCTLSSRHRHMVTGIDANGTSIYTTHWKCSQDGVAPTDPWKLEAKIFP